MASKQESDMENEQNYRKLLEIRSIKNTQIAQDIIWIYLSYIYQASTVQVWRWFSQQLFSYDRIYVTHQSWQSIQ